MITDTQSTDALAANRGPDGSLPHGVARQLPVDTQNAAAQVYKEQTSPLGERITEAQAMSPSMAPETVSQSGSSGNQSTPSP